MPTYLYDYFVKPLLGPWWLLFYVPAIVLYIIFMAFSGWHTIDLSPERAAACAKVSFLGSMAMVYLLFVPAIIIQAKPGTSTIWIVMTIIFGYFLILLPYLLVKFVANKIPIVNLIGPFLLMFAVLPYLIPLKIHGNLGKDTHANGNTYYQV